MAQAEVEKVVDVEMGKLLDVITKYEAYPEFVDGVSRIEVERKGPGQSRVKYWLKLIKDIEYVVNMQENREHGEVKWTLAESSFLNKNEGGWKLTAAGPGRTKVHYSLEVEFKVPVPGLILRGLIKSTLPSTVESFVKRAKQG
ncbi:MAG: type II toxin-antitoxin system RatA family toxin [Bacteriovoracia bacterium]